MRETYKSQSPQLFITRRELADRLGVSQCTVTRLEKRGTIPSVRVGGQSRFEWTTVIENLKAKEVSRG